MGQSGITEATADPAYVLPSSIDYLKNNALAHDLVDALRWGDKPHCPRCTSSYAKRVNTTVFRQLYRCVDCGYMFNSQSGTIFHGSKMPLYTFFHFFIMQSAVGELEVREVCFALDVSHKTASILMRRGAEFQPERALAVCDRKRFAALSADEEGGREAEDSFFEYCAMKSIVVRQDLLEEHIARTSRDESGMRALQDSALVKSRRS